MSATILFLGAIILNLAGMHSKEYSYSAVGSGLLVIGFAVAFHTFS